jgi:uncharacterized protein YbaP (TraB family)
MAMTEELRTKEESNTPQTDAVVEALFNLRKDRFGEYVPASFARAQERRIDELETMCQQISELISGHDGHVFDDITNVLISKW